MQEQISFYENKLQFETDAWDVYEALNKQQNIVIIDARSADAYALEHIPTAVNIPHRAMSIDTTSKLDKTATCIVYCDGIGCNASTKGALNMSKLGFQVKELLGGLDWWKRDGYATEGQQGSSGKNISCGC